MAAQTNLNPHAQEYLPISSATTTSRPQFTATNPLCFSLPPPPPPPPPPPIPSYILTLPAPWFAPQPIIHVPQHSDFSPMSQPPTVPPPPPSAATATATEPEYLEKSVTRDLGRRRRGRFCLFGRKGRERVETDEFCLSRGEREWGRRRFCDEVLPLKREENRTTVMIKNIPNRYSRGMLLKMLNQHLELQNISRATNADCISAIDFFYLPIDFRTKCNKGYAFVNFTDPLAVWKFYDSFHCKPWDLFESTKILHLVSAKIQGKEALVKHFEKSVFVCESDEFLPVCFSPAMDGSGKPLRQSCIGKRVCPTNRE